ncbi:thiol-disulfide oxidoreductase [Pirellulimonas nuda]|uniref:Thiol-disulfide oxidoreductase n=1 Tax=Pirellulimonas nuda TaxID=2528009 RepID=A0A518D634_9BACT|nr:redoxin domain-containing protein [Pirellulimonas nuda]QDU86919.1 thiol-disulfide oxidoreductase [Pirellulimonas nuda]
MRLCSLVVLASLALSARAQSIDFALPNVYGKQVRLADFDDNGLVVVAFLGVECPLAKLYGQRLAQMAQEYEARGVAFIGVDSNRQDSLTELAAYGRRLEIPFPLLKDNGAQVADLLGAQRTPEVFLLNRQREVVYQGRIDDQYGVGYIRDAPQVNDLRDAIDAVLAGELIANAKTHAPGCVIGRGGEPDESSPVTYSNQIARVFQKHCLECHRNDEIAPFALTDYDEAAGWAETIAEVIRDQRMPPWHADPQYGHYHGERLMTAEEKQLVYDWVEAGAPQGDPADLPEPKQFVTGWRLPREPDLVVPMRSVPYEVAAEGVIEYQYFAADPKLTEDKWIQAADIVPGCRGVVHHVIVFISPPGEEGRRGLGWLGAYVPGQSSMELPKGQARLIPAGSKLIFQVHYTPTGSVEKDLTKLGLVFADPDTVTEEVVTMYAANGKFEIPPGDSNYPVKAAIERFPAQGKLLGMGPHMHVRGKSFRMTGVWPDGAQKVLLDVPAYDFNWQHGYGLKESIPTVPGFRVECLAHFDNSKGNLVNPDPTAAVRWGDQTFQEMMIAFFEVAVPRGSLRTDEKVGRQITPEAVTRAQATADKLFERFDHNRDGLLQRDEMPDAFRLFAFERHDLDGDKSISSEEAFEAALERERRTGRG